MAEHLIRVQWGSRAVGFRRDDVEESYALSGNINGVRMELSDDIMSLLPLGEVVLLEKLERESDGPPSPIPDLDERASSEQSCVSKLFVHGLKGKTFTIRNVSTLADVERRLMKEGISCDGMRLTYCGQRLEDRHPLSFYGMRKDSTLDLTLPQKGAQPVIYLLPPYLNPIPVVDVSVLLVPQWRFSQSYPLADTKLIADSGKERVAWSVSARHDGTLVELSSGLELPYLFWEAEPRHGVPSSPPPHPRRAFVGHFDPAAPTLDRTNAVCLPFAGLLPVFVTHLLPRLSKAPFVALRFLPRAAYDRAAELRVSEPAPDVVTRVFMLFRGVPEAEVDARRGAMDGGIDWAEVVDVPHEATDGGAFRVLEWGAMKVL
ncbi:uncharacterized protein BXZ73DRAFT_81603 [Epithele typhae]|uniref:uncharacterized protein n=1 Tax=Epithele typhae TaxID=378194 RepID=UPI002008082D|nr:uncharacterized protein BXZ73DRAFT_81603 [Epithele typhae]KAH9914627.1 hypothetical protein BXZ73DRAFT_81603 [Epithele typhae]